MSSTWNSRKSNRKYQDESNWSDHKSSWNSGSSSSSSWKERSKSKNSRSWTYGKSTIDPELLRECSKRGWQEVTRRKSMEESLVEPSGPAYYHQLATPLNPEAATLVDNAIVAEGALQCLKEREIDLESLEKSDWRILQEDWPQCHNRKSKDCSPRYQYRSLDGSCNNLQHPFWGASTEPFRRLLPAEYEDELSQPKPAFPKGIIPPGRQVSICMQNQTNQWDEPRLSMLFVHFAMFLDHDLSFIPTVKINLLESLLLFTPAVMICLNVQVSMVVPSPAVEKRPNDIPNVSPWK